MAAKKSLVRERLDRVRHRAVCDTCNKRWPWREDLSEADADANRHWNANPTHDVTTYTEQTVTTVRNLK